MKKLIIATTIATLMMTGCANDMSNAQKGAGIGAVLGAVLGKATGDHDKSRLAWGAVVGAIAGGAIGNYMDKQEEEFRKELADSGVEVYRDGDTITLRMPGNITFDTDSNRIDPRFYPVLNDVALVLNKYEKTVLKITGHTDSTGSDEYNQSLSEQRAASVKNYLLSQQVDNRRITTVGMGEYEPLVSNDTAELRQQNRRVELQVFPLKNS
ncbi:OmpA family protein [Bowmanella sp. JS7-9]|uniref:OmpA family protein n=1 Tax=Pseudobowmanella zhangzhouensis TaxID=1537679 RepID=A0ABW1XNI0_9ALTE|nr:OmpA family protein [Bowmanella sp. JS7-9]